VSERTLAIVGPGVVGTALGVALRRAGWTIGPVVGRTGESAERAVRRIGAGRVAILAEVAASVVLVTVPDRRIAAVAEAMAAATTLPPDALVVHTSGYHSSRELAPLAARGAATGSIHPLQSFASVDEALERLVGTRCFFEGDEPERQRLLIEDLGAVPVPLATEAKPLYHAAAATASNLLVTVVDLALAIAERGGLDREEMLAALMPLVTGSVRNVGSLGLPAALTGPIARGDAGTVAGHLEALAHAAPELLPAYSVLSRHTIDVALRKGGLDEARAEALRGMLKNVDRVRGDE
jgi:predicted short-subunit dehydrogenase-like oxidoreductase (DUF2520 family)